MIEASQEPTPHRQEPAAAATPEKKVFLLAAFEHPEAEPDLTKPVTGMAQDVLAVIAMSEGRQRFEWVGRDSADSIAHPALVTPVKVRLAVSSPWHDQNDRIMTGLVQLAPRQLGDGSVDDDVDHLLAELAAGRPQAKGPGG